MGPWVSVQQTRTHSHPEDGWRPVGRGRGWMEEEEDGRGRRIEGGDVDGLGGDVG